MGWTFMHTEGKIDKNEFLQNEFADGYTVLKTCAVGSVWYSAVLEEETSKILAYITLTSKKKDYFNFGYKMAPDYWGPNETNCPKSILVLLTPTENEIANKWRDACYANLDKAKLSDIPVGGKIMCKLGDDWYELQKMPPMYNKKRDWWCTVQDCQLVSVPKTQIKEWKYI